MTTEHPATTAPEGYALPKLAADLMACAEANGWVARAAWVAGPEVKEPFVYVKVGRKLSPGEEPVDPTDPCAPVRDYRWMYRVTWHSRGCAPGKLRLFRKPLAATPWRPTYHDGPSVLRIKDMIRANPKP